MDAETRSVKAKTVIGERTYCEATPGKEFWVVVRVLDLNMHNKLYTTGEVIFHLLYLCFHTNTLSFETHRFSFSYSHVASKSKAERVCDR